MLQKISISNKHCSFELSIIQRILKKLNVSHVSQIFGSTTVSNSDNNQKCLLSSKSAYYNNFWRSCDTEDWSNDAEISALITEINYILTHIHIENTYFKL